MKSFLEYCYDKKMESNVGSIKEEADFGEINIGGFIEPVMRKMASLIGDEGLQAVIDVVSGYGNESPADYKTAKKDLMKALWSSDIPDDCSWAEKQFPFWAGCLGRACKENDPSILAKVLTDLQKEVKK